MSKKRVNGASARRSQRNVCVYCGSGLGLNPAYRAAARTLGAAFAANDIGLVYGGGNVGLMGVIADAAIAAGGEVIGVIPQSLKDREIAHTGVRDLRVVDSMHTRKAMMADLSDAFIAMPGGVGTFEEIFEAITWTQLGVHRKPCGFLNVAGFYAPLIAFIDQAVSEGFIKPLHRAMIAVDDNPERLLDTLATMPLPDVPKWIRKDET